MATSDYNNVVEAIYVSYFGRPADKFGYVNFKAQMNDMGAPTTARGVTDAYLNNPQIRSLIDSFGSSAESAALYGSAASDTVAFVTAIYNNLLNRDPDFAGLAFWTDAINSGRLSRANASLNIMAGATDNMTPQGRIDAQIVATKVTVATMFTDHIDTGIEISAYSGDAAAAKARVMLSQVSAETDTVVFTQTVDATIARLVQDAIPTTNTDLVVGVDTHAGTYANDTFNAVNAGTTLSASDSINGSDGYDTLNIYASAGVNDIQAGSITSVETINIYNTATSTAQMYAKGTLDASMFVGSTAIWQIGSKAQAVDGLAMETTAGFRGTTGQVISVAADGATASIALDGVGATAGNVLDINVSGANVTKVVLAGSTVGSNTTVDLEVAGSPSKLMMIDALGLDGSLIISTNMLANGGTLMLGTGKDVVTVGSNSTSTGLESIGTLEKADAAALGSDATLAAMARANADVLVFGAGATVANANDAVTSGTIANGVLTFTGAGPSSVSAAIAIADAAAETAGEVVVFEYRGSSFVFQQAATDIVVRLTGTANVTNLVETGADTNTFFIV